MLRVSRVSLIALGAAALAGCAADAGSPTASRSQIGNTTAKYLPAPPDASGYGPYFTTAAEYRLPSFADPDIIPGRVTEVWAKMYRPAFLPAGSQFPLVLFLHGNHGTCGDTAYPRTDASCQYTNSGFCSGAYPIVTPNHLGYEYVATRLASWGYFVVSINANRGITCAGGIPGDGGLNLARGRLVLKHLQRLSEWSNGLSPTPGSLGVDLSGGYIDFSNVGLMGHSRGGEGVRAAYNQYRDFGSPWPTRIPDDIGFAGIFEIGPVDGQTSRTLNADSTNWAVLLPMCDGDVSNLQGVKPFDRQLKINESNATPKATFTVWGTNHNYYNTQWQRSDSSGCTGPGNAPIFNPALAGSSGQQTIGIASMMAFFRGYVGASADSNFANLFDPQYLLTGAVTGTTRVDRGYTDSPSLSVTNILDDIPGGSPPKSSSGLTYSIGVGTSFTVGGVNEHDGSQTAAAVRWNRFFFFPPPYWQSNWFARDVSNYSTLDIRLERQTSGNPGPSTSFTISLVKGGGALSGAVASSSYVNLNGPVGGPYSNAHTMLQTARIPLTDFPGFDPSVDQLAGVRLTFDRDSSGAIFVANIRADGGSFSFFPSSAPGTLATDANGANGAGADVVYRDGNAIEGVAAAGADAQDVEMTLVSPTMFEAHDELTVLDIGGHELTLSHYPDPADLHRISFTIPRAELARIQPGAQVTVKYGRGPSHVRWEFGAIDPARLTK